VHLDRAREISRSLGVIEVTYDGDDVWLEELDEESQTALVKNLKSSQQCLIPLSMLQERNIR
jgi:small acid-soluble spore protein H (minor)